MPVLGARSSHDTGEEDRARFTSACGSSKNRGDRLRDGRIRDVSRLRDMRRALYLVGRLRSVPAQVHVTVQTNATLLDQPFLELFRDLDIMVGVSLDRELFAHDRGSPRSSWLTRLEPVQGAGALGGLDQ
jgi:hypothetical protein